MLRLGTGSSYGTTALPTRSSAKGKPESHTDAEAVSAAKDKLFPESDSDLGSDSDSSGDGPALSDIYPARRKVEQRNYGTFSTVTPRALKPKAQKTPSAPSPSTPSLTASQSALVADLAKLGFGDSDSIGTITPDYPCITLNMTKDETGRPKMVNATLSRLYMLNKDGVEKEIHTAKNLPKGKQVIMRPQQLKEYNPDMATGMKVIKVFDK